MGGEFNFPAPLAITFFFFLGKKMLYFNTLFEGNPAPVAYHVSPDKPMNFPSKPANNNTNTNMSKPASSPQKLNTEIDDSDREIANLVADAHNA